MIFGVISLLFTAVIIVFAVVGIRETINKHPDLHGMLFIRDFFKYLALFIAVLITCFGLSGILTAALNYQQDFFNSKLDLARWMSFTVIGIPLIVIISRWISRDFTRNPKAKSSPVWHIYLLFATGSSLMLWFLPLQNALRTFAGAPYSPRAVSSTLIAFFVWVFHMNLYRGSHSLIANVQFFFGSFVGFTGVALSLISFVDSGISTVMNLDIGKYQLAEAIILLITALPLGLFYFGEFGSRASSLELRIFSTFGGLVPTVLFVSVAATLTLNTVLVWYFGETEQVYERFFNDVPGAVGAVVVLTAFHFIFRALTEGFERDQLIRIYQYLVSGGTLIAGSVGFGTVLVGLLANEDRRNLILLGLSLMAVTCTNWIYHWRLCQGALLVDQSIESKSPVRRGYMYFFIGAPIIFAIGSLVWLTFNGFKALLIGNQEIWQSRYPISTLATTLLLAFYHYRVLQRERVAL